MGQSNKSGQRNPNNPASPNKGRSMVPVNHALKYTEEDMLKTVEFARRNARGNLLKELGITDLNTGRTPSSARFDENGEDRFPELINQERSRLMLGDFTDDALANLVFMQGDISKEEDMRQMLAAHTSGERYYSKIAAVTAGKERIRWLSRHLEMSLLHQRSQRTTIWNYIIDMYGPCGGEASILEACEKLGLPKEYALARLHPGHETVKEE